MQKALKPATPGLEIRGPRHGLDDAVLTGGAVAFVAELARAFGPRIEGLLARRAARRARLAAGEAFHFLADTESIRAADWTVAPIPVDLAKRVVEITGPVDQKMIINALNSGADAFMADFEDSTAPTWRNVLDGQRHLRDAVRGTIAFEDEARGRQYRLGERTAVLMVRPRGLHLPEDHIHLDGTPVPGSIVDFGLFFFHNARALLDRGSGPYFYLPKLEGHLEARLWNDIFLAAQDALGIPRGSIRATVLIETLPAAFEMDEILYELRDHAAGLNCGRWDYIFSFIKSCRHDAASILPDRSQVTMEQPCMRAYTQLVVKTCHRRGVHAMGGMAAQIPIKEDTEANERALEKVRADKRRESKDGHDGTWVAHPGLVSIARDEFEAHMEGPNQLARKRADVDVGPEDLLRVPRGTRTEEGLRLNVRVGVQYLEAWIGGTGCVPLYNLMEDAATAEISRAQVWQWIRHGATLDDGRAVTPELFAAILESEMAAIEREVGPDRVRAGRYREARDLFASLSTAPEMEEFLTLPGYRLLNAVHDRERRS